MLYRSSKGQDIIQNTKNVKQNQKKNFERDFKRRGDYAESILDDDSGAP